MEIILSSSTLTLQGSPEESVGCILTGSLMMNIVEPLKVKSLHLTFLGTVAVDALDGESPKELVLTRKQWVFLESKSTAYWLEPDQYLYDFGIVLSGKFPESVRVRHGRISYKLIAIAERPGLHFNVKVQRIVDIKRTALNSTDLWMTPHSTSTTNWDNRLLLSIFVPMSYFITGSDLAFSLKVISLETGLNLIRGKALLREVVTYTLGQQRKPTTRYYGLSIAYVQCHTARYGEWEFRGVLSIPYQASHDCNTGFIQVSHQLIAELLVTNIKKVSKTICLTFPIILLSAIHYELAQSPPSYLNYKELSAPETAALPPPYNLS